MNGEALGWGAWARHWAGETLRWVFRRRSVGSTLVKCGAAVVVTALGGGWIFSIRSRRADGEHEVRLEAGAGVADAISKAGFALGCVMILAGLGLIWRDMRREERERQRRRVVVVEQRGLLPRNSAPLAEAVPPSVVGTREVLVVDHTTQLRDGIVVDRAGALTEARQLRRDLTARLRDVAPSDATIVYGGVSPVPLTFLAGVVLDDEGAVRIMDWDRFRNAWRELDGADDGERLSAPDIAAAAGAHEVALAVTVSYAVDEDAARALYPGIPFLTMRLSNATVGNHWSEEKQQTLAGAFVDALVRLEAQGVQTVHLFFAAPNSVVFRFGRSYDGRNMPAVIVYQYERSDLARFPWGVRVPHHGEPEPSLYFPTVPA